MSNPLDNPNIQALRAAATLAASAPAIGEDTSSADRRKAEDVREQAEKKVAAVAKRHQATKDDIKAVSDPSWVHGLSERERSELASMLNALGPLNVPHYGYARQWIDAAKRAGTLEGLR